MGLTLNTLLTHKDRTLQTIDKPVVTRRDRLLDSLVGRHLEIQIHCRCTRVDLARHTVGFASNYLDDYTLLWVRSGDLTIQKFLVLGLTHLVLFKQVDPKLESMGRGLGLDWYLGMDNTATSRHPLQVARSDGTIVAGKVLLPKLVLEHVGHSPEATVGVVWESAVLIKIEFVEEEEGVVVAELGVADRAINKYADAIHPGSREDGLDNRSAAFDEGRHSN